MGRRGIMHTCERCGATLFRAETGPAGVHELDGGHTRVEHGPIYEPLPDGWSEPEVEVYGRIIKAELCPDCAAKLWETLLAFLRRE